MEGSTVGKVRRCVTISTLPDHAANCKGHHALTSLVIGMGLITFSERRRGALRLLVVKSIDDNGGLLQMEIDRLLVALTTLIRLC